MVWEEVALSVVTLGMLGSIGYTILLARSIDRDERPRRILPTLSGYYSVSTWGRRYTSSCPATAPSNVGNPQPGENEHR
ncbi:hypothetical protein ACFWPH_31780 [Nocardia sp. NPDC058499]|uniref:hypothetical protein n=1 Tax=Nocardia sp. NPDC058499 TaxID=3346530 RepID=UPI003667E9AC